MLVGQVDTAHQNDPVLIGEPVEHLAAIDLKSAAVFVAGRTQELEIAAGSVNRHDSRMFATPGRAPNAAAASKARPSPAGQHEAISIAAVRTKYRILMGRHPLVFIRMVTSAQGLGGLPPVGPLPSRSLHEVKRRPGASTLIASRPRDFTECLESQRRPGDPAFRTR